MTNYYIDIHTIGQKMPTIISEEAMEEVRAGRAFYFTPDRAKFMCEAESTEEAYQKYWSEMNITFPEESCMYCKYYGGMIPDTSDGRFSCTNKRWGSFCSSHNTEPCEMYEPKGE